MISKTSFIGYLFRSYFQALKEAQEKKPQQPVKVAVIYTSQEDAEMFPRELVTCLNKGVDAVAKESISYNVEWFFTDTIDGFNENDFDLLISFTTQYNSEPSVFTVNIIGYTCSTDGSIGTAGLYFVGQWDQTNPEKCRLVSHTDSDITLPV